MRPAKASPCRYGHAEVETRGPSHFSTKVPRARSIGSGMTDPHTREAHQLFVRHQPRIKGFILALLPDFAAADDVLQETFLVVQRKVELPGRSIPSHLPKG